jgi:hypothetical protein
MFTVGLLVALLVAVAVTAVFIPISGRAPRSGAQGWGEPLLFFLVVMLATWALGAWIMPFGPLLWGVPWLTFLFVGVIVALVMVTATAPATARRRASVGERDGAPGPQAVPEVFSVFFWVLLALLMMAALTGYWL